METKEIWSPILGEKITREEISNELKNVAKYVAVGFLVLLTLGFFTSSQRINAGQ